MAGSSLLHELLILAGWAAAVVLGMAVDDYTHVMFERVKSTTHYRVGGTKIHQVEVGRTVCRAELFTNCLDFTRTQTV